MMACGKGGKIKTTKKTKQILFVYFVVREGEGLIDRNKNRPGYKKTKVGWIPKDWEVNPLGSVGFFSKGAGISNYEKKEAGVPCITYGEIYTKHNFKIKNFHSFIDKETAKKSRRIKKK